VPGTHGCREGAGDTGGAGDTVVRGIHYPARRAHDNGSNHQKIESHHRPINTHQFGSRRIHESRDHSDDRNRRRRTATRVRIGGWSNLWGLQGIELDRSMHPIDYPSQGFDPIRCLWAYVTANLIEAQFAKLEQGRGDGLGSSTQHRRLHAADFFRRTGHQAAGGAGPCRNPRSGRGSPGLCPPPHMPSPTPRQWV